MDMNIYSLSAHEYRCTQMPEVLDHLELEFQVVVNCLLWVLGTKSSVFLNQIHLGL